MRTYFTLALFLILAPISLLAQDYPQVEIFGGYQYEHQSSGGFGLTQNGWNASVAGNMNKTLGVAGDFSGVYKSVSGTTLHTYTFTFGPVVSFNHEGKVNPFVHALFGPGEFGASGGLFSSASSNAFTMMYGGGADVKLSQRFAYRLVQADWIFYHFSNSNLSKNVRLSSGIVLRF
jgi:hypothetical protein